MSAQSDLKARAKSFISEKLSLIKDGLGMDTAAILSLLMESGYKVSDTSVRRYVSELMEDGIIKKVDNLYKIVRHVSEVIEEVAEDLIEEAADQIMGEENIEEVDDDKILETVIRLASDIIRAGKTASFLATFKDETVKTFACNNLERLPSVISKILPDESLIQKVEVCEATAATIPVTKSEEKAEEKKVEEKAEEKKKGGRTKKSEPATKPATKPAKPSKYTRANALADVLKETKLQKKRYTKADLIMHSNNQYIGHGGKDNLKEAKWYFSNVIGILELMGVVKVDGEVIEVA